MSIDIRLMGHPQDVERFAEVIHALEHLQATGEVRDMLREVTIEVVSESADRANRGRDKRVRRYVQIRMG
jgi:S-ribosylhomocysteine lyase LuxS involved in autoinducer biosynthesis